MSIHVQRAYDTPVAADGVRVLVDRLWPRGVAKADAGIDVWLKEIAPTTQLRQSWHSTTGWQDGAGYDAFCEAYREELTGVNSTPEAREALDTLRKLVRESAQVTLVTASKHPEMSHVAVILEVLGETA